MNEPQLVIKHVVKKNVNEEVICKYHKLHFTKLNSSFFWRDYFEIYIDVRIQLGLSNDTSSNTHHISSGHCCFHLAQSW